jgi:hypothetical protein
MAKKGSKVYRVNVSWGIVERKVKVGKTYTKKKFNAVSAVTKEAATALGLIEFNAPASGAASAYKKASNGASILNRGSAGTTRGNKAYVSIGERTPKGNLKYYTVPVPQGVSLTQIHKVCKNVKYIKWKGGNGSQTPQKGGVKALPGGK